MLAQPLRVPQDLRTLDQPGWIYQRKLDGLRCVAVRNGDQVELWSRNHLSFTDRFPAIVAALAALPADNFTIDGELVAFDGNADQFRPACSGPRSPARPELHVFDLLHLLGRDTTGLPLSDRRRLLAQAPGRVADHVRLVEAVEGDPRSLLDAACRDGWEGLIAKRAESTYRGGRSPDWRKLKCTSSSMLVVGGWTDPSGQRIGPGGAARGLLRRRGCSCTMPAGSAPGSTTRELAELHRTLSELTTEESPFVDAGRVKGSTGSGRRWSSR